MKRAKETAEIIAKNSGLEDRLVFEERLIERETGSASNFLRSETGWIGSTVPDDIEGVEKIADLFSRVQGWLDEISEKHQNDTILLVSHGVTIKAMLTILENLEWDRISSTQIAQAKPFQTFEEGKK